jgi:hypothetical protein
MVKEGGKKERRGVLWRMLRMIEEDKGLLLLVYALVGALLASIGYQVGYWMYPDDPLNPNNPIEVAFMAWLILACPTPVVLSFTHKPLSYRIALVSAGLGTGTLFIAIQVILDLMTKFVKL